MIKSYQSHSEEETVTVAQNFTQQLKAGQTILLGGDLGAGKSLFTRALIRYITQSPDLNVPSPTFTLCQNYETPLGDIWHYDLYRLKKAEEIYETGWEDIVGQDIIIVEWPDRLGNLTPQNVINIKIEIISNHERKITIEHE